MAAVNARSVPPSKVGSPAAVRDVDSTAEATSSLTPELVIALCGPTGSQLER